MWTKLKRAIQLLSCAWFAFSAGAQPSIPATSLPALVGEYSLSYVRTNTDISGLIGVPGSNYWDFSQPQATDDDIGRMDVVPVSDGGNGSAFAEATFAEKFTGGLISGTSWEYYDENATDGLVFYGTYEPVGYGADPSVPILPPTSIMPPVLFYGESWTNGYGFDVVDPLFGDIPAVYQANDAVDAYGILKLPGFGEVPALRLTQIENYYEDVFGDMFLFQSDTNWQWLTPGIGFAAQIVSYAPNASSAAQPYTNGFSRVFLLPPSASPTAVSLTVQSNIAALAWGSTPNANGYVVQTSTNLALTNWTTLAQLTNFSISFPTITGTDQQFFHVIGQP
ncbi:MAG TPA: hypothetical protein VGO67_26090 [Verrucomicrobiae bacterium]|jgi:hypothetical protein